MKRQAREFEKAIVPCSFKMVDGQGALEGYASTFGGPADLGGDIIIKGAFAKTIKERVFSGVVPLLDTHDNSVRSTLGTITEAWEDDHGLGFRSKISSAPSAQDARIKAIEGHVKKLSIGYSTMKEAYGEDENGPVRYIQECKLWEISLVPLAMNENTSIHSVKSLVPFHDHAIASLNRPWDENAARDRAKAWAGDNLAKYRRLFVHWDPANPKSLDGYRLQVADIVDGQPVVIPDAVLSAVAGIASGRISISDDAQDGVKRHLESYLAKLRETSKDIPVAPWADEKAKAIFDFPFSELSEIIYRKAGRRNSTTDAARLREAISLLLSNLSDEEKNELLSKTNAGPRENAPTTEPDNNQLEALQSRLRAMNLEILMEENHDI